MNAERHILDDDMCFLARKANGNLGAHAPACYGSSKWPSRTCSECGRVFDLTNEDDAGEWYYGHDCEAE